MWTLSKFVIACTILLKTWQLVVLHLEYNSTELLIIQNLIKLFNFQVNENEQEYDTDSEPEAFQDNSDEDPEFVLENA